MVNYVWSDITMQSRADEILVNALALPKEVIPMINEIIHSTKRSVLHERESLVSNKKEILQTLKTINGHLKAALSIFDAHESPWVTGEIEYVLFEKFRKKGEELCDWSGYEIAQEQIRVITNAVDEALENVQVYIPVKWEKTALTSAADAVVKLLMENGIEVTGYAEGIAVKLLTFVMEQAGAYLSDTVIRKAITKHIKPLPTLIVDPKYIPQ